MKSHKDIFRMRNDKSIYPDAPSTKSRSDGASVKSIQLNGESKSSYYKDKTGIKAGGSPSTAVHVVRKSPAPSKKWYDKSGIQGMILFIVMIILDTAQLIQTNDISRFYVFCTGVFLGIFAVGER